MTTTRLKPSPCPFCGKLNDAATGLGHGGAPRPGDAAVCVACCRVSLYDDDLALRAPDEDELPALRDDIDVLKAVAAAINVLARRSLQ